MLIHVPEDPEAATRARAAIVADGRLTFGAMGFLLAILEHAPEWSDGELDRWTDDRHSEDPSAIDPLARELVVHGYASPVVLNGERMPIRDAEVFAVPQTTPGQDDEQQVVYVIGQRRSSIAKVGTTSNLRARLRAIQTGHPFRLEVLWYCRGGRRLESWLHENLAPRRLQGEWFDFDGLNPVHIVRADMRAAQRLGIK